MVQPSGKCYLGDISGVEVEEWPGPSLPVELISGLHRFHFSGGNVIYLKPPADLI